MSWSNNISSVRTKLVKFNAPAAASATAITAAFGGEIVNNDPTNLGVAITQPVVPRNVSATFGANWGAANHIKVYGTDQFTTAITETLNSNPGGVTTGTKCFATITKITKTLTDAVDATNICSIGIGVKLGIMDSLGNPLYLADNFGSGHLVGTGFDAPTLDTTLNTVSFATAPNGARIWHLIINVTAVSP